MEAAAGSLDVGRLHACALLVSPGARCWGYGGYGALGYANTATIGDDETPAVAGPLDLGAGRAATAIAAGEFHSCALLDAGAVSCWGFGADGRLGYKSTDSIGDDETPSSIGTVAVGGPAKAVTAGVGHTCAVLNSGDVRCWGYGNSGALGYGNPNNIGDDETPGSVAPVDLGPEVGTKHTALAISAGFDFTCALLDDKTVRCWGYNASGRLGIASPTYLGDSESPASVPVVDLGGPAQAISAGGNHACAVLTSGSVRCWGLGANGRLGYGNTNSIGDNETPASAGPVDLAGNRAKAVSAGGRHTCAILENGSVRCWGANRSAQLGYPNSGDVGDDETPGSLGPVDLGPGRSAVAISAGEESTCARLDNGTVRCWGYGVYGRLGYCNQNTVGDDELPGSVGPVNLEPGDGGAGCPGPAAAGQAPLTPELTPAPPAPPATAGPMAPVPDATAAALAAEKLRSKALGRCLARAGRSRRERRRCLKRYGRTPGRVSTLTAEASGPDTITLSFKAPGTDHAKPPAARSYIVKQSSRPIRSQRDFQRADALCDGTCDFRVSAVGGEITLTVDQLEPHSTYYYAVVALDNVSARRGARSTTVKVRTR